MVKKNFNVTTDIKHTLSNNMFEVVSGDTGNSVTITVTDGSAPVDLTGCRIIVLFRSNSGTAMQDSLEDNSGISFDSEACNRATVELFPSSYSPGMVECELQIYSGEDMRTLITTSMFNFTCRASLLTEDTLSSAPEYPLLTRLIKQCSEMAAAEEERKQLAAKFEGMTVSASPLSPDSPPAVSISEKDNVKHISFGIPEGRPGLTPHIGDNGNWWLGQQDTGASAIKNTHAPDWSQNDSAADDHIKNRTHWKGDPVITLLMPETTITIDSDIGAGALFDPINLVDGGEYIVIWNNTEYICTASSLEPAGWINAIGLGNLMDIDPDNSNNTGEPFMIMELAPDVQAEAGFAGMVISYDGSLTSTLSISSRSITYHKLDNKYLNLDWLPMQKPMKNEAYDVTLAKEQTDGYFDDYTFISSLLSCDYIEATVQSSDGETKYTCPRIDTPDGVKFECTAFDIHVVPEAERAMSTDGIFEGSIILKQPPSSPVTITIVPYVNTNKIPCNFLPEFPMIGLKYYEEYHDECVERNYHLKMRNKALILMDESTNRWREIGFSPQKYDKVILLDEWENNSTRIQFPGMHLSNLVMVAPSSGFETMWQESGIKYMLQEDDYILFTCETLPPQAVWMKVMIFPW